MTNHVLSLAQMLAQYQTNVLGMWDFKKSTEYAEIKTIQKQIKKMATAAPYDGDALESYTRNCCIPISELPEQLVQLMGYVGWINQYFGTPKAPHENRFLSTTLKDYESGIGNVKVSYYIEFNDLVELIEMSLHITMSGVCNA